MKWDPEAVALEMEVGYSSTGTLLFDRHEWLTHTQIKGFFGRLAAGRRKKQVFQTSSQAQRPSALQAHQFDSDEQSEDLDTSTLDADDIIFKVTSQYASQNVLQVTTAPTNIQQHKKKDISVDDIQNAAKRQHK